MLARSRDGQRVGSVRSGVERDPCSADLIAIQLPDSDVQRVGGHSVSDKFNHRDRPGRSRPGVGVRCSERDSPIGFGDLKGSEFSVGGDSYVAVKEDAGHAGINRQRVRFAALRIDGRPGGEGDVRAFSSGVSIVPVGVNRDV